MVFSEGTLASITRVMETLNHFGAVTGLAASLYKSNIFLAGMKDEDHDRILESTIFSNGSLPIRYLGLPLLSKK